jgi:flagellar protein FliS
MSNQVAAPQAYRQSAVISASPVELVVQLYDAARRFLRQGSVAMEERKIEEAHKKLRRAELILNYLASVIDEDQGEVGAHLRSMYAFCLSRLNEARMTLDASKVQEVSTLLGELRDAWQQVADA